MWSARALYTHLTALLIYELVYGVEQYTMQIHRYTVKQLMNWHIVCMHYSMHAWSQAHSSQKSPEIDAPKTFNHMWRFLVKKTTHCKDASKEMCFIIKGLIGLLVESLTWPREQCSVDTCMAAELLPYLYTEYMRVAMMCRETDWLPCNLSLISCIALCDEQSTTAPRRRPVSSFLCNQTSWSCILRACGSAICWKDLGQSYAENQSIPRSSPSLI